MAACSLRGRVVVAALISVFQTTRGQTCGPGEYWSADAAPSDACMNCPEGRAQSESEHRHEECQVCPAGKESSGSAGVLSWSEYGPTECTDCTAGRFAASSGSGECTDCETGQFIDTTGATACRVCPAGKQSADIVLTLHGPVECEDCEAGSFAPSSGSGECTDCEAGQFVASTGATACTDCVAGKSSDAGFAECGDCEAGSFAASSGSGQCTDCEAGQFVASTGATACTDCVAGKYSDAGFAECADCHVMHSTDGEVGATGCTACAVGKMADAGAARCEDRPCDFVDTCAKSHDGICDADDAEGWDLGAFSVHSCEPGSDWLDCDPCPTKENGVCDTPGGITAGFAPTCGQGTDFVDCNADRARECHWERRCPSFESRHGCEAQAHRGCYWDEATATHECKFSKSRQILAAAEQAATRTHLQLGIALLCATALGALLWYFRSSPKCPKCWRDFYSKRWGEDKQASEKSGSASEPEDSVDLEQRSLLAVPATSEHYAVLARPVKFSGTSGHEESVEVEHGTVSC